MATVSAPHSAGGLGQAEAGEFGDGADRPVSSGVEHGMANGLTTGELEELKEDAKYGVGGPPPAVEAFGSTGGGGDEGEGLLSPEALAEEEAAADRLWDELNHMWRMEDEEEDALAASANQEEAFELTGTRSRGAHTRVVSTLRTSHERAAASDRMAVKLAVAHVRDALGSMTEDRDQALEELVRAESILGGLEAEGDHLAGESERVAGLVPARPDTIKKIERRRAECRAAYIRQRAAVEAAKARLAASEHELRGAEIAAVNMQDAGERVDADEEEGRALQEERAVAMRQAEERAADRIRIKQRDAKDAYQEEAYLAEDRRLKQVAAAREGRRAAVHRLRAQLAAVRDTEEAQGRQTEAMLARRTEVVLKLKGNMERAFADTLQRNAVRAQRTAKKARTQETEFAALIASGKNPYEVFRKRDEDARVARLRRQRAAEKESRRMGIVKQMLHEEDQYKESLRRQRAEAEFRREFDQEMGVAAREARVQKYMESTTRDGRDFLDPTGRRPVNPSDVTRLKTWDFGLGTGADPEVVQMLQATHNADPQPLLLPRRKPAPQLPPPQQSDTPESFALADPPADDKDGGGPPGGPPPQEEISATSPQAQPPASGEPGKLWEPKLSKAERAKLASVRDRQRANLTAPQVVCGREFSGDAFLPTPKVLQYLDFEVGRSYTAQVVLTNVSFSFNSFRLLDIEDEYRDFFTIEYSFPGRMSAGTTCILNVTFEPRVNEDIDTCIPLVAETGYINVPLQCRTKKCALEVSPPRMKFAAVLAESHTQKLRFVNSGAIGTDFELLRRAPEGEGGGESPFEFAGRGRVEGYSSATVDVTFAPRAEGLAREEIVLNVLEPCATGAPESVPLEGRGREVPIVVDRPVIDMRTCMHGELYRETVRVHNRGSATFKCSVVRRRELADFLDFNPDMGYCQARSFFDFQLKMRSTPDTVKRLRELGFMPEGSDVMELPVTISVPNQAMPVNFILRARLTPSDLKFDPPVLDFGEVPVSEAVGIRLKVTNMSSLPQRYGFVGMRKGMQITPSGGFGTLLPHETAELVAAYSAESSVDSSFDLVCRTLAGREFRIPCLAQAEAYPVVLDHNVYRMPATAVKDSNSLNVWLTNKTKQPQTFEFAVPEGSDLKVSPVVGTIPPRQRMRVQLDYSPKPDPEPVPPPPAEEGEELDEKDKEVAAAAAAVGAGAGAGVEGIAEGEGEGEEDGLGEDFDPLEPEWIRRGHWHIPCYVQGSAPVLLEVYTAAVLRGIELDGSDHDGFKPGTGYYEVDFGMVPNGETKVRTLVLSNVTVNDAPLTSGTLDHDGVFTLLNVLEPIESGATFELKVAFMPQVSVEPAEALTLEGLDMGDVLAGESSEATLTISNTSKFPVTFQLLPKPWPASSSNLNGIRPFIYSPGEGKIEKGGQMEVKVTFSPDHEGPHFDQVLEVKMPCQDREMLLRVTGRGWERGLFVAGGSRDRAPEDPFHAEVMARRVAGAALPPMKPVTLSLPGVLRPGGEARGEVYAGAVKQGDKGVGGEWTLGPVSADAAAAGWKVEVDKGKCDPGARSPIVFTFNPAAEPQVGTLAYFGLAEWSECAVECVLKGGSPPAPPEGEKVVITARAYLDPNAPAPPAEEAGGGEEEEKK